jgi:hypothetical protein
MPGTLPGSLLLLATAIATAEPVPISMFIMPLEARSGITADDADQLGTLLAVEAARVPGFKILTYRDADALLSVEARAQLLGCDTQSCAAQVAGALNSDEVLFGSLGRLGQDHLLTVTRLRVRDMTVVARTAEAFAGADAASAFEVVRKLVQTLLVAPSAAVPRKAAQPTPPSPAREPAAPAPPGGETAQPRVRTIGSLVGLLAVGTVPLGLVTALALALLAVSSPVAMVLATLLGVLGAALAADRGTSTDTSLAMGVATAFMVYPGAWAAVGLVLMGAWAASHLGWPQVARLASGMITDKGPSAARWALAPVVGGAVGSVTLVPAMVAMASGSAVLLFITALLFPQVAHGVPAVRRLLGSYGPTMLVAGLGLCVVSFAAAAVGVAMVTGGTVVAAVPLFATAPSE